jgi:hypothetical protein
MKLQRVRIRATLQADDGDDANRRIADAFRDANLIVVNVQSIHSAFATSPGDAPGRVSILAYFTFDVTDSSLWLEDVAEKALSVQSLNATNVLLSFLQ